VSGTVATRSIGPPNHLVLDGLPGTVLVLAAAALVRLVGGRGVARAGPHRGPAGPDG
jgi:hypothetical protein